jgi:hypothetical protein
MYNPAFHDPPTGPKCSAGWRSGLTNKACFHQMLFWENAVPERGTVHRQAVLAYHQQHPKLYSPAGCNTQYCQANKHGETLILNQIYCL